MKAKIFPLPLLFALVLSFAVPRPEALGWEPAAGHTQIPLWPGKIPHATIVLGAEETVPVKDKKDFVAGKPWTYVHKVSKPTMTVYSPAGKNTGAAVLIFPGGGYQILAIDLEGTEVCDWLNSKGITSILLKYRVPGEGRYPKSGAYPNSPEALEDAQRAMGMIRQRAAEWHIDPHKIGVLGFSAGGHLVGAISTITDKRLYRPVDAADKESCRPDFAVALYPGHMMEHTNKPLQLNPFVTVTKNTPPTLIIQAEDDPVDDVENSIVYYTALKKAGVPAEMHLYAHGKHAFGMRHTDQPITDWPELLEKWLKSTGILPAR